MNGGHMPGRNGTAMMPRRHKMMMHMTFFWGTCSIILFTGWPGMRIAMYAVTIVLVFVLYVLVEWLSHCHHLLAKPSIGTGISRVLLHPLRMGLVYLAMLALMSFNAGLFLAVVVGHAVGHAVGFLAFRTRAFGKAEYVDKATSDLPWMSC